MNLGGFTPIIDEATGEITGYKTTIGGADTVFPFKSNIEELVLLAKYNTYKGNGSLSFTRTADLDYEYVIVLLCAYYSSPKPTIMTCTEIAFLENLSVTNDKSISVGLYKLEIGQSVGYSAKVPLIILGIK